MSFGKRLLEARKKKGLSQQEVAKKLNTKAPVIGRYERDEAKPSIEAAARLSVLLGVSLDYLVGNTDVELDNDMIKRIIQLQVLPEEDKYHILYMIDNLIKAAKLKML